MVATDAGGAMVLRRVLLRVSAGPDRGAERLLEQGTLLVGSSPDADLVLHDPTVSRNHAEIALLVEGVRVRDLRSTNGTFVGDSRIESAVVPPGAELRFGKTRVEVLAADLPLPDQPSESTSFGRLVGGSAPMRRVFAQLERLVATDVAATFWGEAGTGKTEASRAVHERSPRARMPLVSTDLGADVPTAAIAAGMDAARGGTWVLERLDEASGSTQEALAASLDRRERELLDVRVLATSQRDPRALVEAGRLGRDLFFHVASVRVELPPLRDRLEDLPRIVHALLAEIGYPDMKLGPTELAHLRASPFRGNVRELRRMVEESLMRSAATRSGEGPASAAEVAVTEELARLPFKEAKERLLDSFEKSYVEQLLARAGGNVSRAADEAGIDRNHLARLARKHGLR